LIINKTLAGWILWHEFIEVPSSYTDKGPVLKTSAFLLTSGVAVNGSGGVAEINQRQKDLAALAVKTWPLS
jgi:hypothetical protein